MRLFWNILAVTSLAVLSVGTAMGVTEAKPETGVVTGKIELPDNPTIRVQLMNSTTTMTVTAVDTVTVKSHKSGECLLSVPEAKTLKIRLQNDEMFLETDHHIGDNTKILSSREPVVLESTGVMAIAKVPYGVGWWWESAQDRKYCGKISVSPTATGKLQAVVELPLEEYMRGVVPSEIGGDSPASALEAQAVAGRSAAVLALTTKIYAGPDYDICSDVACQAFSGLTINTPASDAAVKATRGMILSFDGRAVSAYYASNCGGWTEDIRNVWPDRADDRAYWNGTCFDGDTAKTPKPDLTKEADVKQWIDNPAEAYCNPKTSKVSEGSKKNWRWEREFTAEELTQGLKKAHPGTDIGTVTSVTILKRGVSGRAIEAEFIGDKGSVKVGPELAIRNLLDPPLRSACMVLETSASLKSKGGKPGFTARGAGWGHGVGMCQTGAIGMSREGKNVREILHHYYPNCTIEKLY